MSTAKEKLLKLCSEKVTSQISGLTNNIAEVRKAANEDTKSSAGDKYETGRAMAHIEIEKLQRQRTEAEKMLQILAMIDLSISGIKAGVGSMISTSSGRYFMSIPLGKFKLEDEEWICLSAGSPLGLQLMGKKSGDSLTWNEKQIEILVIS